MKNKQVKYKVGEQVFKTYSTAIDYATRKGMQVEVIWIKKQEVNDRMVKVQVYKNLVYRFESDFTSLRFVLNWDISHNNILS